MPDLDGASGGGEVAIERNGDGAMVWCEQDIGHPVPSSLRCGYGQTGGSRIGMPQKQSQGLFLLSGYADTPR